MEVDDQADTVSIESDDDNDDEPITEQQFIDTIRSFSRSHDYMMRILCELHLFILLFLILIFFL